MFRTSKCALVALVALAGPGVFGGIVGCGPDGGASNPTGPEPFSYDAPWPADLSLVLATVFEDGTGDQEAMPVHQAGPPYSGPVPFPPVDVTRVSVGIDGDFMYMRVDFAGAIPTDVEHVQPDGEIEEQWVRNQGMNIALNSDGDIETGGGGEGVHGIDVFFAIGFEYGIAPSAYCNYDFAGGDLHRNREQVLGEVGEGGAGAHYAIARYDISQLGSYLPRGATVDVGSWSEAESFNHDGSLKYHHFAFDRVIDGQQWAIPLD